MKVENVNVTTLSENAIRQVIESKIADGWVYTKVWQSPDGGTWLKFEKDTDN